MVVFKDLSMYVELKCDRAAICFLIIWYWLSLSPQVPNQIRTRLAFFSYF